RRLFRQGSIPLTRIKRGPACGSSNRRFPPKTDRSSTWTSSFPGPCTPTWPTARRESPGNRRSGFTIPGTPRRIHSTLHAGDRLMIVRSRTVLLALSALLGAVIAAPGAWAVDITRGGKPAELTVTSGGAHSVRVTLKPVGMVLPPSPSLLNLEIKDPAIR